MKTKILMLAVTLQTMKCENIVSALHGDDKTAQILFPRRAVTIKCKKTMLAGTLQAFEKVE
ncbi:hypothetical protein [Segatella oulorum]|uniref:hypothetical protein n=1 Tax=Segatella oulorum TaxID=28136 RepID=UPI0028E34719|nr:hypothetical protein [Segatella oulorum]